MRLNARLYGRLVIVRPDFYYYLFLEPSSQENYRMKIKIKYIFWGISRALSSQKIHKNEIKFILIFSRPPP
jgi:hypothetical protein